MQNHGLGIDEQCAVEKKLRLVLPKILQKIPHNLFGRSAQITFIQVFETSKEKFRNQIS